MNRNFKKNSIYLKQKFYVKLTEVLNNEFISKEIILTPNFWKVVYFCKYKTILTDICVTLIHLFWK